MMGRTRFFTLRVIDRESFTLPPPPLPNPLHICRLLMERLKFMLCIQPSRRHKISFSFCRTGSFLSNQHILMMQAGWIVNLQGYPKRMFFLLNFFSLFFCLIIWHIIIYLGHQAKSMTYIIIILKVL